MRFGNWRGLTLALGLACVAAFMVGGPAPARAQDFHTIPRLVPAVDVNTGGPYYAPPIPYGHYVGKNHMAKLGGKVHGLMGGMGHGGAMCGACGGKGCGACGGSGLLGHGGGGLLGHGGGACNDPGCGMGMGHGHGQGHGGLFKKCGLCGGKGCGACANGYISSPQGPAAAPVPSAQVACGDPGCHLFGKHGHKGCGACGGKGCGGCAFGMGNACGACGGKGCGLCGNGMGNACGACGGKGCGLCGRGMGGGLCKGCGGKGCGLCSKAKGLVGHMLGHDKIKWFVGPGGPIPLTPGYTPYVNVTRSPRDFFAFPPFSDR